MHIATNPKVTESPVLPTAHEASLAKISSQAVAAYIQSTPTPEIALIKEGNVREKVAIPPAALRLLADILTQMSKGNAVTIIPIHAELTTQEAADLLNVSRPYLVNLLEHKEIPFRKVGMHRRVLAKDILAYKAKIDEARLKTLAELTKQAQENDMGY